MTRNLTLKGIAVIGVAFVFAAGVMVVPVCAEAGRAAVVEKLAAGNLKGSDFSAVTAPGLTLEQLDLSGSNWQEADLRGLLCRDVSFRGANLRGVNMRGAVFENVDFTDADLGGADLSGALVISANFSGAKLAGCRMDGLRAQALVLGSGGGNHLAALQLALSEATDLTLSRPWLSGLTGDAFAFVYNTEDALFHPGTPFMVNPMLAAAEAVGVEARFVSDYLAERMMAQLGAVPGEIHVAALAPVEAARPLVGENAVWGVAVDRADGERGPMTGFALPPLGQVFFDQRQLRAAWTGPWTTLEPLGAQKLNANWPLYVFTRTAVPTAREVQARRALRQGARIMGDRRTYGPMVPGAGGLARLAADIRKAVAQDDAQKCRELALWGGAPRVSLLAARHEACEFLEEAIAVLTGDDKTAAEQALSLLQREYELLSVDWPNLHVPEAGLTEDARTRLRQAADRIGRASEAESRAAAALTQISAQE